MYVHTVVEAKYGLLMCSKQDEGLIPSDLATQARHFQALRKKKFNINLFSSSNCEHQGHEHHVHPSAEEMAPPKEMTVS